ncbi:hypothetical protein STVIR_0184 [Streptomyces viridochromogenes Tue57]|uniref:Uncharacterized protein n=1 Tax=Streptomyces viridochromogenes Tue57 TaxID=1160705 RepID=L8PTX2_STRVR|nr:hypothetical protein STVIR_0184 [Streptomyces viridochromogenes Tue57]
MPATALTPLTAQAAPHSGTFRQGKPTGTVEGMRLKYCHSGRCGSFARIENSRANCAAVLERSD